MKNTVVSRRWLIVLVLFIFILLHQMDAHLVRRVVYQIQAIFYLDSSQVRNIIILGVVVGVISLPLWGYLADRFSRKTLLGLAGLIWGMSSWLMGISPTSATFTLSFAANMLDSASYPVIFSLLGDLFQPHDRGKAFGLVQSARPAAFLFSLLTLGDLTAKVNWRVLMFGTGVIGVVLGLLAFLLIKDPKRGQSEPAMKSIRISGHYVFDKDLAKQTVKKPGLMILFGLSFVAAISWNIVTSGMVTYLEVGAEMSQSEVIATLIPSLLAMTLGYIIGGLAGDIVSWRRKTGRILVSVVGNVFALITFTLALRISPAHPFAFIALLSAAGIFMAMIYPNMAAMVFEITLPELRSTAIAWMMVFQLIGGLIGSLAVQALSDRIGLQPAMAWVMASALGLALILLTALLFFLPGEIDHVREHLAFRSKLESRLESQE